MSTFSKQFLSESSNGGSILIVDTASPGTLVHTAVTGTTNMDEVWLYGSNLGSSATTMTIQFGGTASKDSIEVTIPASEGLVLTVPGFVVNNSIAVRAFCTTASGVAIHGFVNRITA